MARRELLRLCLTPFMYWQATSAETFDRHILLNYIIVKVPAVVQICAEATVI
jgi:hypothetical protein